MLLTHIPATTQRQHTPLRQDDYPQVRFWTRQAWNSSMQDQIPEVGQPNESEDFPDLEVEEGDEHELPVHQPPIQLVLVVSIDRRKVSMLP